MCELTINYIDENCYMLIGRDDFHILCLQLKPSSELWLCSLAGLTGDMVRTVHSLSRVANSGSFSVRVRISEILEFAVNLLPCPVGLASEVESAKPVMFRVSADIIIENKVLHIPSIVRRLQ